MGNKRRESIEKRVDSPAHDEKSRDEDLLEYIRNLEDKNKRLEDKIKEIDEENRVIKYILNLEGLDSIFEKFKEMNFRIHMTSADSSKPSSSDGFKKSAPKSRRTKTGMGRGGQPGHKGHNMPIPHDSDVVMLHYPEKCKGCTHFDECSTTNFVCQESRYVVDLIMDTKVTEHRTFRADNCQFSNESLAGQFPEGVTAHVQYGDSVSVVSGLLSTYGAVSCSRISSLVRSMFGVSLSPGTVVSMVSKCAEKVSGTLKEIKKKIIGNKLVHFDETGARTEGGLYWVQSSSTSEYTYQIISAKRGMDGMEENGVLPFFRGIAVHDGWKAYWRYDKISHAICNAHILRELVGIGELEPTHRWSEQFAELLMLMKSAKERAQSRGETHLSQQKLDDFSKKYDSIMRLADMERPSPPKPVVKTRGRQKKGRERSLIERLQTYKDSICLFIHDFDVPFDNNQAERDVRNVKTKVKVSGCFRSRKGAQDYLDVMSYLGTGRKHDVNPFDALVAAFKGQSEIVL